MKREDYNQKHYAKVPVEIKNVDTENNTLEAIFSTQDVDRHGDTVVQEGWDLKSFKKNPVILNSHNYDDAAEVIGKASNVRVEKKKLQGTIQFAVDENPKAKVIFDLYAGGYLNAFSVGFIPKKFEEDSNGNIDPWTIEEAELIEVSSVSVPANERALAKQKGIDVDALNKKEQENDDPEPGDIGESGTEAPTDKGVNPENNTETPEEKKQRLEKELADTNKELEAQQDEPEEEPEEEKQQKSKKQRAVEILNSVEEKRRRKLARAAKIVSELQNGEESEHESKNGSHTESKKRKRKINQAIRSLLDAK